jgi:hypothetical protein
MTDGMKIGMRSVFSDVMNVLVVLSMLMIAPIFSYGLNAAPNFNTTVTFIYVSGSAILSLPLLVGLPIFAILSWKSKRAVPLEATPTPKAITDSSSKVERSFREWVMIIVSYVLVLMIVLGTVFWFFSNFDLSDLIGGGH